MSDNIKVSAAELHGFLTDLARTASADTLLPVFNGVIIWTDQHDGNTVLVGESCDRFTLGLTYIAADGEAGERWLALDAVKTLVAALAPFKRDSWKGIELTWEGDTLTVMHLAGSTVVRSAAPDNSPKLSKLFKHDGEPTAAVKYQREHLEKFTAVAKRRKAMVRLEPGDSARARATHVFIGDTYRGLLMPVRVDDKGPETKAPLFLVPSER